MSGPRGHCSRLDGGVFLRIDSTQNAFLDVGSNDRETVATHEDDGMVWRLSFGVCGFREEGSESRAEVSVPD